MNIRYPIYEGVYRILTVNSANFPALKEAWMGTNSVGFALMNTQSYNLVEVKDGEER